MDQKIFDGEFFKKLENISINARMAMNEGAAGGRRSKAKGSSVEFADFREYTPGDDFRRVDWNAYGRFGKLFLKLFMEEREAFLNIFVDCSKSMDYGEKNKAVMSLRLAGVLSYLALNNLDRVCINKVMGEEIMPSPSYMGKGMFQRALTFLESSSFEGHTSLSEALKRKELKSRGIAVVISDFFTKGSLEDLIKYLAYKKQHIILIQVLCEEELSPELGGQVRLVDSETKEELNLTITPKLMKLYETKLKAMETGMKEWTKRYGAVFLQVSSSEELQKVVFEKFGRVGII
jgi:uncharacterized protein (DUF58 family)